MTNMVSLIILVSLALMASFLYAFAISVALGHDLAFTLAYSAALLTIAASMLTIARKHKSLPIHDIGFVYVSYVLLYAAFPVLKFVLFDFEWPPLSDIRLLKLPVDLASMAILYTYIGVHVLFFCIGYFMVKHKEHDAIVLPKSTVKIVLFFFCAFVFLTASKLLMDAILGVSDGYNEKLLSISSQPQIVKQLYFLVNSSIFGVALFTLVLSLLNWDKCKKYFFLIIIIKVIPPLIAMGSRHEAVTFLFLGVLGYHLIIQRIASAKIILIGLCGLLAMLIIGALRSYSEGALIAFVASNEFEASFATFYENILNPNASPPWTVYVSDFLSLFPQQLLPFEKIDSSRWYLNEYMPGITEENPEIGYGFGVISEVAIGLGIYELIVKSVLVGAVFAWLKNKIYTTKTDVIWLVIYFFCIVTAFRTFRSSSFELIRSIPFTLGLSMVLYYLLNFLSYSKATR